MPTILDDDTQAKIFLRQLTETIAWCLQHANANEPEKSLRTIISRQHPLESRGTQVFGIAAERERQLWKLGLISLEPVTDLRDGRLLAFDPDGILSDGAASLESRGFFDSDNVPPCDTWVDYIYEEAYGHRIATAPWSQWVPFESYLVAWVPPQLLELADAGISVIPEQCVVWLDELDLSFTQALRRRKLLI